MKAFIQAFKAAWKQAKRERLERKHAKARARRLAAKEEQLAALRALEALEK